MDRQTLIDSGRFYPRLANNPDRRLRYYATQFPIVEVDSSYYAMPKASNAEQWVQRTPRGFVMNIKAFRLMTGHATTQNVLPSDLVAKLPAVVAGKRTLYPKDVPRELLDELFRRFKNAIEPLRAAGKLGLVHFQFAPWVRRVAEDIAHIRYCVESMQGYDLSI